MNVFLKSSSSLEGCVGEESSVFSRNILEYIDYEYSFDENPKSFQEMLLRYKTLFPEFSIERLEKIENVHTCIHADMKQGVIKGFD